jgi:hypothetical protein
MNYARPQAITGVTSSVTGYAHEPRKHFGINGALRNIGNVYRVKMRIDVGASTLQNSEPRENIFGTGPNFLTGKIAARKIGRTSRAGKQLLRCCIFLGYKNLPAALSSQSKPWRVPGWLYYLECRGGRRGRGRTTTESSH